MVLLSLAVDSGLISSANCVAFFFVFRLGKQANMIVFAHC